MFWGLIMEPGKKYSQTVEKSFHVSHAALDLDSAQSSPVQVLLGFEGRNYLLCTLNKDKWIQVSLDLNFQVGDKVSFATNGPGHVHLTGFLIPEEDLDLLDEELSDEEEQEDEEEVPELLPINNKKRKADTKNENKNKKVKSETAKLLEEINEDDTDDEDDSDVNLTDLLEEEADEAASDEEDEEEDDDDDEDDEEDDDEEDDNVINEEKESFEEEKPVKIKKSKKEKPQQNGIAKNEKHEKHKKDKTPKQNKQVEKSPKKEQKSEKSPKIKGKRTLQGGVIVEDLKIGDGAIAQPGRQVSVYYEGRLQSNNKLFDSTKKGNGFKFRLGRQEVIKGWDIGVNGMKAGGKRRIICPPQMAYGAQGSPPVIPPQSTLVFEVELNHVK